MDPHSQDEYEEYSQDDEYESEEVDEEAEAAGAAKAAQLMGSAVAAAMGGGRQQQQQLGGDEDEALTEEETEEEEESQEEEVAEDWRALPLLPESAGLLDIFTQLRSDGRRTLTVLLLGKSGVGKSSTVNSLLGEKVAAVSAFKLQPDTESSATYARQVTVGDPNVDGFTVRLIDTCGLEDPEAGDTVNYMALERIAEDIKGQSIDVVLYCDRLDLYRVEPLDKRIMQCISETFGRRIWSNTLLLLTHGNLTMPPPGTTFESFTERRISLLRAAVRGAFFKPGLPAQLAENSDTCKVDADGCRTLPDGSRWLEDLWGAAADLALSTPPYVWRRGAGGGSGGAGSSRRSRLTKLVLIPLLAYGQFMAFKTLLQPRMDKEEKKVAEADEAAWAAKAAERKRLGIGPPLKPSLDNQWRLEQMYDDE